MMRRAATLAIFLAAAAPALSSCTSSPTGPRLHPAAAKVLAIPALPFILMYSERETVASGTVAGQRYEVERNAITKQDYEVEMYPRGTQ